MKMKSATWLNACQLASAERGAVVLRCGSYSGYTSCRQPTGGVPAGNDLVLRPPAAETAAAPPGSARAAHAAEDSRSTPRTSLSDGRLDLEPLQHPGGSSACWACRARARALPGVSCAARRGGGPQTGAC